MNTLTGDRQGSYRQRVAGVTLRAATFDDAALLHQWTNDPETRRQSFSTEPVPWDTHLAWVKRVLDDPERSLYIAEDGGPVGMVRLDREVISLSVAPERRGQGYAVALIAAARAEGGSIAEVKPTNDRSIRAFRSAGFAEIQRDSDRVVFASL